MSAGGASVPDELRLDKARVLEEVPNSHDCGRPSLGPCSRPAGSQRTDRPGGTSAAGRQRGPAVAVPLRFPPPAQGRIQVQAVSAAGRARVQAPALGGRLARAPRVPRGRICNSISTENRLLHFRLPPARIAASRGAGAGPGDVAQRDGAAAAANQARPLLKPCTHTDESGPSLSPARASSHHITASSRLQGAAAAGRRPPRRPAVPPPQPQGGPPAPTRARAGPQRDRPGSRGGTRLRCGGRPWRRRRAGNARATRQGRGRTPRTRPA